VSVATATRIPYAGFATRAVALVIDLALAQLVIAGAAATLSLVASLVGELRPTWLVGIFVAIGWTLAVGGYMVLFWSVAGQTPGMRVMGVRVVDAHGNPPGFGRSIVRFIGLVLAIIPCFLGFLPVLIDDRRRGIQDMLAGTVVLYADTAEPAATPPSSPAPAT
jgi:uncharacterized RDD family membrane protein YckC